MRNADEVPHRRATTAAKTAVPFGLALLAAALAFAGSHGHALLGHDSYPILATSRVESLDDLASALSQKLMAGRYPGDFYRPLLSLGFALDHALWGTEPKGYHLTDALLFGASALVVFLLSRRLLGGDSFLGPLAAMLVFMLHPTHVEVLSVPARRPEMLCWLFMGLALTTQADPRALRSARPRVLPAALGFLAMASKETGLLLPGFAFLLVAVFTEDRGIPVRLRRAAVAAAPHAVALAAMLAIRFAILGGLGGHHLAASESPLRRLPRLFMAGWAFLVGPQPVEQADVAGGPGVVVWSVALALGLGASLAWVLRRPTAEAQGLPSPSRAIRTSTFGLVWLAAISTTYAFAGGIQAWYMLLPVAGFAVFLGALASLTRIGLSGGRALPRASGLALFVAIAALAAWQGRFSPLVRRYEAWDRATRASDRFFGELSERLESNAVGGTVRCPPVPRWAPIEPGKPSVRGASILANYSIQAWIDLRFPSRRIRVTASPEDRALPGESLVLVEGDLPGFDAKTP